MIMIYRTGSNTFKIDYHIQSWNSKSNRHHGTKDDVSGI